MKKMCSKKNCCQNIFGGGFCKTHQYLRPKKEAKESKLHLYVKPDSRDYLKNKITFESDKYKIILNNWFKERRLEMKGFCENCGKKTMRDNDAMYKFSIAHIIPKSPTNGCPSVGANEYNWIELCIDCHTKYDSTWEQAKKMAIWDLAKIKVQMFLHLIPKKEYKKFLDNFE